MEYSIIVPVYNVEKYIHRCIDSILNQTFQDFELILIDDGSPDNSGEICDEYAKKDTRIKVIHQKNAGVSSARNKGIEIAKGKYLVFVDSDDEVKQDYLESMNKCESDLVVSGVKHIANNGEVERILKYQSQIKRVDELCVLEMIENYSINFVYAKRFDNELIKSNNLAFSEKMDLAEDTFFCAKYILLCNTVTFVESVAYFYYKYDESTLSSFNDMFISKMIYANKNILQILEESYPNIGISVEWKSRCWKIFYNSIFFILREWNASIRKKIKLLQYIFDSEDYMKLEENINSFVKYDSKFIRYLLKKKNAYLLLIFWKMIDMKRILKNATKR